MILPVLMERENLSNQDFINPAMADPNAVLSWQSVVDFEAFRMQHLENFQLRAQDLACLPGFGRNQDDDLLSTEGWS